MSSPIQCRFLLDIKQQNIANTVLSQLDAIEELLTDFLKDEIVALTIFIIEKPTAFEALIIEDYQNTKSQISLEQKSIFDLLNDIRSHLQVTYSPIPMVEHSPTEKRYAAL